jgi:hypothetical protein
VLGSFKQKSDCQPFLDIIPGYVAGQVFDVHEFVMKLLQHTESMSTYVLFSHAL